MLSRTTRLMIVTACVTLVSAHAAAQSITKPKQGQGGSVVQGAAGTDGSVGAKGLEHCGAPMGALAVVEPQDEIIYGLRRYNLQSPVGLIRMMIQQSNCFIVVERGLGMRNLMQERDLASAGESRQGSNMGGGLMVAADFVLTPSVVFSENNAGGGGAAVAGLFGHHAATVGAIAGASSSRKRRRACSSPIRAAVCRWPLLKAARRKPTWRSARDSSAAGRARPAADTATPTRGRSSRPP